MNTQSAAAMSVAILGVTGRMGRALLLALDEAGLQLGGASASSQSPWVGRDAGLAGGGGERGVLVVGEPAAALAQSSVAIDFTLPQALVGNLAACVAVGKPLVIGTTGLDEAQRASIREASRHIAIVQAANMSLGVNLLLKLVEQAAAKLDAGYDIEIFEAHHRHKKDAPSGTALALGHAAAAGRNVKLEDVAEHDRHGISGARAAGAIGFSVFRGGDVVGDHTVSFAGIGERIELTHRASDRLAFARGAVTAARWLAGRPAGLYSMQDVLGI